MIEYSVIIPAYNEEKYLPGTLERLNRILKAIPRRSEIIVVDNNSTDRTAAVAEEWGASVVFEGYNQISRSRNRGATRAKGKYLFFIDADTLVTEQIIIESLAAMESGKIYGGGSLVNFQGVLSHNTFILAAIKLWETMSKAFRWACGAYVFCHRDAFEAVGGFSENVYASEEIFFSIALRKWGRKRDMDFIILNHHIETSPRKLEWFGIWGILKMVIPVLVCPFLVRSRKFCQLWYNRP